MAVFPQDLEVNDRPQARVVPRDSRPQFVNGTGSLDTLDFIQLSKIER
jgi:hypothetical protein